MGESVYGLLDSDTKTLDSVEFNFSRTVLIHKFLEATGMENYIGFTTPNMIEAPILTYDKDTKSKKESSNSYAYIICMMLYLSSNT